MTMKKGQKIHSGVDGFFNDAYGLYKRKTVPLRVLRKEAEHIIGVARPFASLTEEALDARITGCRTGMRLGQTGEPVLQAIGLICEAARRSTGMSPYVEQIMSAMLIQERFAIQMHTGEGKTLTAAIAAVLNCWRGSYCHIVTSNDYLAKRDAELMALLYTRCGLNAGHVISGMQPHERRVAYDCDVVYSTSKELLADFLRDRMTDGAYRPGSEGVLTRISRGRRVMRGLHTAIVDEADSVLADEATVPLIISMAGKNRLLKEAVATALDLSGVLKEGEDYIVERHYRDIKMTQESRRKIEETLKSFPAVWSSYERSEYLIKQALIARHFYHRDVHYVVHEGKIVIVDEKTGRMMHSRNWSGGLHQAIEVKEGIELTDVTESQIQMSFQMFFRLYKNLSGMSGTLQNIERELWSIYGLRAVRISTHAPKRLTVYPERILPTAGHKWDAVIDEILSQISKGKAVLVGTRSIKESEALHIKLKAHAIDATVLNALRHEQEAAIVAHAGRRGTVTIATNMAGRGTDILVDRDVLDAGGLHVIATERHESRRVDMQLFGRTARQGQPGSARMMLSLDDEVMRSFSMPWLVQWLGRMMHTQIGSRIVLLMYMYFQHCAEKTRSRLRKRILEQDLALSKVMSFTRF
jgi:preprotein translocase subunit SecA